MFKRKNMADIPDRHDPHLIHVYKNYQNPNLTKCKVLFWSFVHQTKNSKISQTFEFLGTFLIYSVHDVMNIDKTNIKITIFILQEQKWSNWIYFFAVQQGLHFLSYFGITISSNFPHTWNLTSKFFQMFFFLTIIKPCSGI